MNYNRGRRSSSHELISRSSGNTELSYLLHSSSAPDLGVMMFTFTSFEPSGLMEFANVFQPRRYGMINCIKPHI